MRIDRKMTSLLGASILETLYGFEVKGPDDVHIEMNERSVESIIECFIPGKYLVDFLPFLKYVPKWMPGASFKRKCAIWREQVMAVRNLPYKAAQNALVSNHLSIQAVMHTSEFVVRMMGLLSRQTLSWLKL